MSKVAITGNASGTGTLTIAAPNTNTDYTLTLPTSTGTVLNDQSNIEAQVKTATNATGSAPIYACRAWVNFDGTGTPAIRASGNVTSITDNGTGDFTVNFTTAMPDANYSVPSTFSRGGSVTVRLGIVTSKTTSTFKVDTRTFPSGTTSGTLEDFEFNDISVFR
jgi:hypothetical protein